MGKKVRWFDALQRILSTSEPDRGEREDKVKRPTSKLKKLRQFGKSSSSNSSSSAAPEAAPAAHPQPPPPSPSQHYRREAVVVTEDRSTGTTSEQKNAGYPVAAIPSSVAGAAAIVTPRAPARSKEELAAIRIQTACRGYLVRRGYQARARAQARLMSLLEGIAVKRQTEESLCCMQTMTRVQTQIYSRRVKTEEDKKALKSQIQLKQGLDKTKIGEGWDHSHQSKEQMEATLAMKQEAASRRQRAMSYAFSRQWRNRNPASSSSGRATPTQSHPPMYMDPGCPNWGWSWSERWTAAARPWECQTAPQLDKDRAPARPKTPSRAAKPRVSVSVSAQIPTPTTPTGRSPRPPSTPTRPRSPSVLGKTIASPVRPPSPRGSPLLRSTSQLSERPRSSQEHLGSGGGGGMEASLRRTTSMRSGETPRRLNLGARDVDDGETGGGAPVTPSYMQPTTSVRAKARCPSPKAADRAELPERAPLVSSPSMKRRLSLEFAEKPGASSSPRTPSKGKPEIRAKRPPSPRLV